MIEPLRAPTAIAQLVTVISASPHTQTVTRLVHSIQTCLAYYPSLQSVLGGYSPSIVAFISTQFYVFATVVLDGIAVTFWAFFALPSTETSMSHAQLTSVFPRLCRVYPWQGDTDDLAARMRDLDARIIARSVEAPQGAAPHSQETFIDLVLRLDAYIVVMCGFLEANLAHSILHDRME
jgi:hypothetical protein